MSVSINDDYDGSTKLSDWYPIVKENFAALAEAADSNADAAATAQETAESAATAAATAQETADGKAPTNHRSTGTTYGVGTNTYYGHVKLSDSVEDSSAAASGGVAATPYAVKLAYDKAAEAASGLENIPEVTDTVTEDSTAVPTSDAVYSYIKAVLSLMDTSAFGGGVSPDEIDSISDGVYVFINNATSSEPYRRCDGILIQASGYLTSSTDALRMQILLQTTSSYGSAKYNPDILTRWCYNTSSGTGIAYSDWSEWTSLREGYEYDLISDLATSAIEEDSYKFPYAGAVYDYVNDVISNIETSGTAASLEWEEILLSEWIKDISSSDLRVSILSQEANTEHFTLYNDTDQTFSELYINDEVKYTFEPCAIASGVKYLCTITTQAVTGADPNNGIIRIESAVNIDSSETTGTTASVATDAEAEEMLDEILSA